MHLFGGQAASSTAGKEHIKTLLVAEELVKYAEAVAEEGYSFLQDLLEADDDELEQLAKHVQMKKPEAKRFLKAVAATRMQGCQSAPVCVGMF